MVRDGVFKLICVPLLALIILGSSDLISFRQVSTRDAVLTVFLSLLLALVIWQGTVMLISLVRNSRLRAYVYAKLLTLCFSTALYAMLALSGFLFLWKNIFLAAMPSSLIWQSALACGATI